jgi:hypothetical protein
MRAGIAAIAALVFLGAPASAQKIVEPEQCILDTLKGSASKDATYIVQINCVRQYLRAVDGIAIDVPPASSAGSTRCTAYGDCCSFRFS